MPTGRKVHETKTRSEVGLKEFMPCFIYPDPKKKKEQEKQIGELFSRGYYIDWANERYMIMLHEKMREDEEE